MERFKKRTLALVLASVVTVVGAFGSENYKNTLMGLKFESSANGAVNMVVQTRSAYSGTIIPMKRDAGTYVLTLPEMNNEAATPDLKTVSSNISSVNIRTMPYSNNAKGYTRITVKVLNPSTSLMAKTQIYVPSAEEQKQISFESQVETDPAKIAERRAKARAEQEALRNQELEKYKRQAEIANAEQAAREARKAAQEAAEKEAFSQSQQASDGSFAGVVSSEYSAQPKKMTAEASDTNKTFFGLMVLLIILGSAYSIVRAKNKMQELAGESLEIDVSDESNNGKGKKLKKIKKAINKLDSSYSKTATMPTRTEYTQPTMPVKKAKPAEELDIVDLDELFQEHKAKASEKTKEEEENDALEDFLSGFSFDDMEETLPEELEEDSAYDEEAYEKILKNDDLKFSQDDLGCIMQLLGSEINDDTMRNIEKYATSDPIKKVVPKEKILEELVTTYAISQNITFTRDDVDALYKLISVELDNDFVTDLRTNPERLKEMQKDILAYGDKPKKPSEIITMSVKDMLPDLSEALKKQGGRKIESQRKAETIYFSEGYEVKTFSMDDMMPDLAVEINKKDAYISKPSAAYDIVDNTYTIGHSELKAAADLPDLQDVLANPEKYAQPEQEEVVVDAEALLKNISNVQFKPFYDGTNEFEVINDFSDAPSVSDIQDEFSRFANFEINQEEVVDTVEPVEEYDDFQALYSNEYVDLDNPEPEGPSPIKEQAMNADFLLSENGSEEELEKVNSESKDASFVPVKLERDIEMPKRERKPLAEELMKKIEATKQEREMRKAKIFNKDVEKKLCDEVQVIKSDSIKCIVDGEAMNVVSTTIFTDNMGCHLAKNDNGYTILGFIGDKLFKIKQYEILKSEKIQSRISESFADGASRYIIRIGLHKFIVNVKGDNIEYIMDLC